MSIKQPRPAIVTADASVQMLGRLARVHQHFDEAYLQGLIEEHPELLPLEEIRSDIGQLVCVGREVPVSSGAMDNLYLSTGGYPVIVETKLWRNPEARREVLAQLLEYIKDLSSKDYTWLAEQWGIYSAEKFGSSQSLLARLNEISDEEVDEGFIVDRVNRALSHGDIVGVVVGDGIETRLQSLVDDLCKKTPHLRYALTLLELACYEHLALGESKLLVVPRIIQNIERVERTYVRIEVAPELQGQLRIRPQVEEVAPTRPGLRVTLTEEDFWGSVEAKQGRQCRELMQAFYADLVEAFELEPEFKAAAVMLKVPHPELEKPGVSVLGMEREGRIYNADHLPRQLRGWGVERETASRIAKAYWSALHAIEPRFNPDGMSHLATSQFIEFTQIVDKLPAIKVEVGRVVAAIREASAEAGKSVG